MSYEKNPVANTFFIGDRLFTFGGNTLFELPQESMKKYFDMDLNVQSTSAYEMFAKGIENFTPKNEFYKENELSKPQTADLQKINTPSKTQEPRWVTQTLDFSDGVPKVKDITPLVSQASLEEIDSALDNNAKELGLQIESNLETKQEAIQAESKPKATAPSNQQDKELTIPKVVATQSSLNIHNMRKSSEVPSLVPEKDLVYQGSDTNYKLDSSNALPMSKKDRVEANLAAMKSSQAYRKRKNGKGRLFGIKYHSK